MKRVALLLSLVVLMVGPGCARAGMYDHPLVGKQAPDFRLSALKGGASSLAERRGQGPAIIFFWATWCPHCREQLGIFRAAEKTFRAQGVAMVLVDIGEDRGVVERFVKPRGYDFDVLLDSDSYAAEMYQVVGIPTVVLVAADGTVRDVRHDLPENYLQRLKS